MVRNYKSKKIQDIKSCLTDLSIVEPSSYFVNEVLDGSHPVNVCKWAERLKRPDLKYQITKSFRVNDAKSVSSKINYLLALGAISKNPHTSIIKTKDGKDRELPNDDTYYFVNKDRIQVLIDRIANHINIFDESTVQNKLFQPNHNSENKSNHIANFENKNTDIPSIPNT